MCMYVLSDVLESALNTLVASLVLMTLCGVSVTKLRFAKKIAGCGTTGSWEKKVPWWNMQSVSSHIECEWVFEWVCYLVFVCHSLVCHIQWAAGCVCGETICFVCTSQPTSAGVCWWVCVCICFAVLYTCLPLLNFFLMEKSGHFSPRKASCGSVATQPNTPYLCMCMLFVSVWMLI